MVPWLRIRKKLLPSKRRNPRRFPRSPEQLTPKYFGPFKPIDKRPGGGLTEQQQSHLDTTDRTITTPRRRARKPTRRSIARSWPTRAPSPAFRQTWKEIVYPIVVKQSAGTRLWDIDNNEYLDVTLGFGTHFFGHNPEFAVRAQQWQLQKGVEVGPQSPLVGKVAELMCELTGMERAAFCNTGSEAVLAAIRLARTVSGRTKIADLSQLIVQPLVVRIAIMFALPCAAFTLTNAFGGLGPDFHASAGHGR